MVGLSFALLVVQCDSQTPTQRRSFLLVSFPSPVSPCQSTTCFRSAVRASGRAVFRQTRYPGAFPHRTILPLHQAQKRNRVTGGCTPPPLAFTSGQSGNPSGRYATALWTFIAGPNPTPPFFNRGQNPLLAREKHHRR